jgi:sigma-B regulation protein RsbU (phosphoserine phosphatase)
MIPMLAPDSLHAQMMDLVRADFAALTLGILITASGIAVLAIHVLRVKSKSKLLLWLGWSALFYGVRVLVKTPTSELLIDRPDDFWQLVERVIGNFILIPALLFTEQIYGKGWRSSMRVLLALAIGYGLFATALELAEHKSTAAPDEGSVILIPVFLCMLIGHLAGYRPPPIAHVRALLIGLTIFVLSILNEHLVGNNLLPWHTQVETLGFFILMCAMGYVAIRGVLDNERNLVVLQDEMRAATRIQASILPHGVPQLAGAQICVRYFPMTAVAGDFYEFIQLDSQRVGIALADVAGHGVPAALVASMVKVAIDSQSAFAGDPSALMAGLNDIMCRQARGKLITAGYLFLDLEARRASYAAAAHPPVLVRRRNSGTTLELKENGLILGVRPSETYELMSFDLEPGDRILLYTDGIAEAANAADQMFSEQRLPQVLAERGSEATGAFADHLLQEVRDWSRIDVNGQADDMTLVVIDIELSLAAAV